MTVRGGLVLVAITVLLLVPESLLRSGLPAWLSDVWFRVHYPAASTLWQSLGSAVPQLGLVVLVLATLVLVVPPAAVWFVTRRFLPGLLPFIDPVNIIASLNPVMFGLALAVFLILEPRGLAYRWEILKISWKLRPFSH